MPFWKIETGRTTSIGLRRRGGVAASSVNAWPQLAKGSNAPCSPVCVLFSGDETMAGDNSYKPGEIVKVSGIYSVVHDDGKDTFEVTCVEGEHFPPTRSGKGAHFQLKYGA